LRVDPGLLPRYLTETIGEHHNLFAYPAQSNFSGVQHPLEWIEQAHAHGWDVMLDAAAFVPTNRLDLSVCHPDFVAISFYKMFGWPTGVGCLLARRQALAKLERPWFSGGTIVAAFVQREYYQSAPGAAHFEDGTVNYLNLPAVEIGLRFLDRIGIGAGDPRGLGQAARGIARRLRRLGIDVIATESFLVEDMEGPLEAGELERARAWGAELGRSLPASKKQLVETQP
jgi:selenocysteine lyase/cysteine desulfurase